MSVIRHLSAKRCRKPLKKLKHLSEPAAVAVDHQGNEFALWWPFGASEITVKVHRGNVIRKMGARSLADLVRMADTLGIRHEHKKLI